MAARVHRSAPTSMTGACSATPLAPATRRGRARRPPGPLAFVLLNRFPYTSGHLMVAPVRHVGDFGELDGRRGARDPPPHAERAWARSHETYAPQGYNVGWNLGRVAGAGVVDHVHLHVVPRWAGDTNFMPVLADIRVIPEALAETRQRLAAVWPT